MNRKLLLWLFAAVMAFCGCDNTAVSTEKAPNSKENVSVLETDSEIKSSSQIAAVEDERIEAPLAELIQPDERLLLYRFLPDAKIYEANKLIEMPPQPTLLNVFCSVYDEVFKDRDMPGVNAVTQQKSYVVFDLKKEWLQSLNKGELYEFCNTLAMTVMQNCNCDNVGFKIDGEFGMLGGECWKTEELIMLPNSDPAEFAAIRAQIPYTGLCEPNYNGKLKMEQQLLNDETAQEIYRVLALAGDMPKEFDHPNDHDMNNAVLYLLWCTQYISTYPQEQGYDAQTAQIMLPLASAVSQRLNMQESSFWLKEHIEQSGRLIYGDDFKVVHQRPRLPYKWFETEGVYTPPHMGGGWNIMPYIFSYSEKDDVITAQVAYMCETMSGICDAALKGAEPRYFNTEDEVLKYLQNGAVMREITLKRENDGRLTVRSHHFI